MRILLFPDGEAAQRARRLEARLHDALVVETVLREYELRLDTQLGLTAADAQGVADESARLARALHSLLPEALTRPAGPGLPSIWDCYGEHFRSWTIAPLAANALIARRAAETHSPREAWVLESPRSAGWWSGRRQVLEAVRAGLEGSGVEIRAAPGGLVRAARALATACAGAWPVRDLRGPRKRRATAPAPEQADVLFLPIGGTSVPIIDCLAPRLGEAHGLSCAAVMSDPRDAGMEARSRCGVSYRWLDEFMAPGACGSTLLRAPGWFVHACRRARGAALGPLWPGIRNRLMLALGRDIEQVRDDIAASAHLLDLRRPRVVVAFHLYWPRIAPIALAARARGIPFLYVQHGVYLAKDDCIRPLPCDELMVFGEAAAESLRPRVGDAPITVVGHCLHDDLAARREPDGKDRKRPEDAPLVVLAAQPDEALVSDTGADGWWVRGAAEACRELGARMVVKLHPQETSAEMYEAVAQDLPETVTVLPHGARDLVDLLVEACALITRDSTVVIEANLLGVPAVTVNLTGRRDRFPFAADGGARGVYRYEDILPALREVIEGGGAEAREAFLARHAGPADGKATERVVGTIAKWAADGERRTAGNRR